MIVNFRSTVSALVYSFIHERCNGLEKYDTFPHNAVTRFVLAEYQRMPDFLRLSLGLFTLLFDVWAIPNSKRPFHRLPHSQRWRLIQNWREGRLDCCRYLIRFYENLTIFGWYAINHERASDP
jgi:hypothetical protein